MPDLKFDTGSTSPVFTLLLLALLISVPAQARAAEESAGPGRLDPAVGPTNVSPSAGKDAREADAEAGSTGAPDSKESEDKDVGPASLGPGPLPLGTDGPLPTGAKSDAGSSPIRGFLQQETAYTYAEPGHLSTAVLRGQFGSTGSFGSNMKWRATLRGEFDPVYAWSDFYPDPARNDQRWYGLIGETYVDTTFKGWDLRLGRQNVVWGEMVGLFFADVVTAKDLRHFILPSFDVIRIPQWAVRGEYFIKDSHFELLWIPYTTFDRIGKPGAEFFPFQTPPPAGFANQFRDEQIPGRSLSNSNVGARFSTLVQGLDLSAFYYRSMDSSATYYREIVPTSATSGTILYTPRHDRIWQTGGTASRNLGDSAVLKFEAVYTSGRSFNVTRASQPGGVVRKDTIDYAVGIDYTLPDDARLNTQVFQRLYTSHDTDMLQERFETGVTALYNRKIVPKWEGEVLWIQSLNRWENLIRPRVIWKPEANLRVAFGVDVFNGPREGFLGRFRDRDRIYVETRYDF